MISISRIEEMHGFDKKYDLTILDVRYACSQATFQCKNKIAQEGLVKL